MQVSCNISLHFFVQQECAGSSDLPKQQLSEYRILCRNRSQSNRIFCRIPNSWLTCFYQVKNGLDYGSQAKSFTNKFQNAYQASKGNYIHMECQMDKNAKIFFLGKVPKTAKKSSQKLAKTQKVLAGQLAESFRLNVRPNINLSIRQKLVSVDHQQQVYPRLK